MNKNYLKDILSIVSELHNKLELLKVGLEINNELLTVCPDERKIHTWNRTAFEFEDLNKKWKVIEKNSVLTQMKNHTPS
jgi:hypothetical protein